MDFENICNTGLSLGLGSKETQKDHFVHQEENKKFYHHLFPSLALGSSSTRVIDKRKLHANLSQRVSPISAGSSFSNSSVKRERDVFSGGEELIEVEKRESSKVISDDQDEEGGARKKLRLTKEQSIILEESFKEHNSLNPKQKHALAKRLNLRARQVEVWFQNRRARTKLKQTEVDCELLKKCCENLSQENRRLQKELQELKAFKQTAPFYTQMPASTLTMCPSCERISSKKSPKSTFPITRKTQVTYR